MTTLLDKTKAIKCLVLDLDGVLTDGGLYLNNEGHEGRRYNVQDGFGLKLLKHIGIEVAVITGSSSSIVAHRMKQIGITHFYTQSIHKLAPYEDLKSKLNLEDEQMAFMGDDYQDLVLLQRVGLSIAPANAIEAVKNRVSICTKAYGGQGAVREICEFFIQVHQKQQDIIDFFNNYSCASSEITF